ncbi:hypothetical protein RZS08_65950, partial [Arthrospira platensis SPKY1]|nr:hypothetical protein [Arthrospira platensis SPKY1]
MESTGVFPAPDIDGLPADVLSTPANLAADSSTARIALFTWVLVLALVANAPLASLALLLALCHKSFRELPNFDDCSISCGSLCAGRGAVGKSNLRTTPG